MDYDDVRDLITGGIEFMSDGDGNFKFTRGGGVKISGGKEVSEPRENFTCYGLFRDVSLNLVNGDSILAGDKRGIFTADVEIRQGDQVEIDGLSYIVVDARPVKPTSTVVAYRPIVRRTAVVNGG